MRITSPSMSEADEIVDLWVRLARGQREYDSHLRAGANRPPVRDAVARHIVMDGLRVARDDGEDRDRTGGDRGEDDGDVLGFVMYSLESGEYEQDVTRGVVRNLFVRGDRRGEGIGTALLDAAEAELAAAGADVVALEAMADNGAARRFYERRGYRPHRVELEKRLGERSESDTHSKEDG